MTVAKSRLRGRRVGSSRSTSAATNRKPACLSISLSVYEADDDSKQRQFSHFKQTIGKMSRWRGGGAAVAERVIEREEAVRGRLVPVLTHFKNPIDVVRGLKVKDVFFCAKVPPSIGRKRSKNVSSSLAI